MGVGREGRREGGREEEEVEGRDGGWREGRRGAGDREFWMEKG